MAIRTERQLEELRRELARNMAAYERLFNAGLRRGYRPTSLIFEDGELVEASGRKPRLAGQRYLAGHPNAHILVMIAGAEPSAAYYVS